MAKSSSWPPVQDGGPSAPTTPDAPGEFPDLGERYRIRSELGRGGVGRVYVAHDLKLERDVAIKVLNPGDHSREEMLRFEQEARAVASLDHPNVLAIHDIGSHRESPYIVSELLRGGTLRKQLEAGPLPARAVLDFALQLAHGLKGAHEKGVIHRDLKPDNIYITDEGVLKILDFGIAKLTSANPAAGGNGLRTQTGSVFGTAEYMSPEQVRGAPVDPRSDIFSFGAVLYEMLAGRRAFDGGSLVETGYAILNDEPAPLPQHAPAELARIALRCLEKTPDKRFQSVRELAHELEAQSGIQTRSAMVPASRWRILAAAGLAPLLASVIVFIARGPRLISAVAPAGPAQLTLLVADFKNATSDPIFEGTFEPILTVAMEGASFINAYKRQDARRIAGQMKLDSANLDEGTARLVALREGIGAIVSGSIRPNGEGYLFVVRAVEPREGKPIVEREAEVADKADVLPALGKLAAAVRSALGDTTPEAAQLASLETFTAGSLEAAHEYATAQNLQHSGRAEDALVHYAKAVEIDPKLGRAYAGMAVVNLNLHRRGEAEQYFQKALALIDRMTERERYRTRGTYYVFERDYDKAVDEYEALVSRFPVDTVGFVNLAVAHCYRRDMQKALLAGNRALQLAPANVLNRANLAVYAMYSGDFEKALRLAREVVETSPTHLTPRVVIGLSEVASGRPEQALEAYQALARVSKAGASLAAQGVADLALYQGRPQEAVAALQSQLVLDEADNPSAAATKLATLASAHLALGQPAAAMKAADRAVTISKADSILLLAARTYLDAGDENKARALAADLAARRAKEPRAYAKLIEGNAALKRGDAVAAIQLLREAQRTFDTWIGRFDLGRAYLGARAFTEAHEELDACLKRRGEATALFIDEVPTARYLPAVHYYMAKAQEGLKSPAAAESYRGFLSAKASATPGDPLVEDARTSSRPR